MKLNIGKVKFHSSHISSDNFDDAIPYIDNLINADVYLIGAYIHALIGVLSLTEYDVRQFLTEQGFGNTAIVSLLIEANCQGACEHPLWRRGEGGELHPL